MADILKWFVNREKQYEGFQKILAGETSRSVMLVESPEGMGKTWLAQRMRYYCVEHSIPVALIDFRDRRPHDYLSLVRTCRDQFGGTAFNPLTALINKLTGVTINLASSQGDGQVNISDISGSSVQAETVVGRDLIKDNQFFVNADSEVSRRAVEIQINDSFFGCVAALVATSRAVVIFDSYEEVTDEAERWILDDLLARLTSDTLKQTVVIVAGRNVPMVSETIKPLVAKTGLDTFNETYVREYIEGRRKLAGLDLVTIFKTSGGFPNLLAKMADVAALQNLQDDEDWL